MFKVQALRYVRPRRPVDSDPSFEDSCCPRLQQEEVTEEKTSKDLSL